MSKNKTGYGFDLTTPCGECPFRNDINGYLTTARVKQLKKDVVNGEKTFACHKTVYSPGTTEHHCAGALILLKKLNKHGRMLQIAERLGLYDPSKLDMSAPVFDSFEEMIDAQTILNK